MLRWNTENPAVADVLGDHEKRRRTFQPDRVCAMPGCDTSLSIYNGSRFCAAHELAVPNRCQRKASPRRTAIHG